MKNRTIVALPILAVVVACGSPPRTYELGRAMRAREEGDLPAAIEYAEAAIQRRLRKPESEAIALHSLLLREADRGIEADAFEAYMSRYLDGRFSPPRSHEMSRSDCDAMSQGLIAEWGALPQHEAFHIGTVAATFSIGASGEVEDILVFAAKHPASAWLIISSVANLRISDERLAEVDSSAFPIPQCAYWVYERRRNDTLPKPMNCMRGIC